MRTPSGILAAIIMMLILSACSPETREPQDLFSDVEYTITEMTNVSCEQDTDCETPVEYLVRSNCPYTSRCVNSTCAVVCPDIQPINDAVLVAQGHVETLPEYTAFQGRDLRIADVRKLDCKRCYEVQAQFTVQSSKNLSRVERATAAVTVRDGRVTDSVVRQGGPEVLDADECAGRGGAAVVEPCDGREALGELEEPFTCCLKQ